MRLSRDQRKLLRELLQELPYASIARQLKISRSTITKYKNLFKIKLKPRPGGRPRLISEPLRRRLIHSILSGRVNTAPEAKRLLGLTVSNQTVRNVLRSADLRGRMK